MRKDLRGALGVFLGSVKVEQRKARAKVVFRLAHRIAENLFRLVFLLVEQQ